MRAHFVVAGALVLLLGSIAHNTLARQLTPPPSAPNVVEVKWSPEKDDQGRPIPMAVVPDSTAPELAARAREVLKVDEAFRRAKLENDIDTLRSLFDEAFYETNQNGNSRDKQAALLLWTTFKIRSLTTDRASLRFSGPTAVMTGEQTEMNGTGTDRMLFTRVYVEGPSGWQLLSATQLRNPHAQVEGRPLRH